VALIDPRVNVRGTWYPNYGAWRSEWHCLSERLKLPELKECTTTEWEYTDCFLGGSFDVPINERLQLPNPYVSTQRMHFAPYLVLRTNLLTHKHTPTFLHVYGPSYVRVDRVKLQDVLRTRFAAAGGVAIPSKVTATRISANLFDKGEAAVWVQYV
jgi:hypothetical protein